MVYMYLKNKPILEDNRYYDDKNDWFTIFLVSLVSMICRSQKTAVFFCFGTITSLLVPLDLQQALVAFITFLYASSLQKYVNVYWVVFIHWISYKIDI